MDSQIENSTNEDRRLLTPKTPCKLCRIFKPAEEEIPVKDILLQLSMRWWVYLVDVLVDVGDKPIRYLLLRPVDYPKEKIETEIKMQHPESTVSFVTGYGLGNGPIIGVNFGELIKQLTPFEIMQ